MFKITENTNERIVVSCEIPPKKYGTEKDVHIDLSNVISYVTDQNVSLADGKWTRVATLYNYTKKPRLAEEFVFVKNKKENVKKDLINGSVSDIISSNIKVAPTNVTRKRARRNARVAKNSTENIITEQD